MSRTESVPEVVERHLLQLIDLGRLAPGQRLDSERAIATALGVSRAAVRDALARMEAAGLVERRHGSGTRVVERLPSRTALAARLQEHADERAHSAELRRLLEPEIARLAAARAQGAQLDRLDELVEAAAGSTEAENSVRLDVAFHVAVASAAGNPLLLTMSELATTWTAGPRLYSHLDDRGRRASVAGHRRIAEAIRSGDAEAAAVAMREHLGEIERVIDENSGGARGAAETAPRQRSGLLDVGDGHRIYWESSGRADAMPALWLHGGPGSGLGAGGYRRLFDPERYRVIGVDQRGCGRSTPLASEPGALEGHDAAALIRDLEAVREHLGIERWVVAGGSWGTTLALAYAQAHPERVLAIGLGAVTTTSRAEVDWITEGVGAIFPEAWARFEAASRRRPGERVVEAYARRLAATGDPADRAAAAGAWDDWESIHVSLDPDARPGPTVADPADRLVFATLVTRYWAGVGLLPDGVPIAERMHRISHIPAVLVHGRHDVSGPVGTAWAVHRAWPASELIVIENEGHGGPASSAALRDGLLRLADALR